MDEHRYRERLEGLFADVERLSTSPSLEAAALREELSSLKSRLQALEEEIKTVGYEKGKTQDATIEFPVQESVSVPDPVVPVKAAPLLYEKEHVGFAYVKDEIKPVEASVLDRNQSEQLIKLPLAVGSGAIGEVKIEPSSEKPLSPEDLNFANTIAQQASLQIQSLRLLESAERARTEAEQATRQYMHQSWESYMDAIHQSERIGYAYDQAAVSPYIETITPETGIQKTVSVMDEQVGTLFIQPDPANPFTDSDLSMMDQVAKQVAQQVENIRLLADAARARAEAEEATRRLTRENWKTYTEQHENEVLAFTYDTIKVAPLEDGSIIQDVVIEEPLIVRGESIGQLKVAGLKDISQDAIDTVNAIARQASMHLEALRLTEELQKRAFELQELDRIKSAFLANMSHELRTPLNSILGFADVMLEELDGPLTDYMNNDLRLIQKNGQHLLHLINDVLDMAKIEAGRMNLNPEKFHIYEILEEVTSITSTLASEKNLSLFIDEISDQETEVYADRTRLRQVMINLVNNSIKFTEKGKIAVKVVPIEGARVLLSVKDTGIGIPPDKLDAVFQEFTQVDTSTTRKVGGTGLGLPISRRLVEMHGGKLWAESTGVNGEGSTFYVELPLEARITDVIEKQAR
jgi:signal transduction histidine kinase